MGVPSLPGGGWGGDGRVHVSSASLDLYPAGFHYCLFFIISIISAVLLFFIIIQMAQLAAFPPSLST